MIRLALRTFADRWQLFVGTILATTIGIAIVHAGMTIILGVEGVQAPAGSSPAQSQAFAQAASGASTLTGMTVMLGVFLTIFVVSSTFGFAIDQRRPDLAIMRIAGITRLQIRLLLLAEAAITGLIGAAIGILLGIILTPLQRRMLASLDLFPDGLATPLQPGVLIFDLIAALFVCLAGAWGTAKRVTRMPPLDALRRAEMEQRVMTLKRWSTAILASALTAIQTCFSATAGGMLIPLLLGLGVVITASVAMNQLSPLLVPVAAKLFGPFEKNSPVAGLAMANLRDAVRRTAACAAPMIVLVSLTMGLQGLLDTQTEAATTENQHLLAADLIATGNTLDVNAIKRIDGVSVASPETTVQLPMLLTENGLTIEALGNVVAVEPDAFRSTHRQEPIRGDLGDFGPNSVVLGPGLEAISLQDQYNKIEVRIGTRTIPLVEAARMAETLAGRDGFYIDRSIVPPELLSGPTTVLIQLTPDAHRNTVENALTAAGASTIQSPAQHAATPNATSQAENRGVMAAIVGMGSIYALISVLSTLAISITQRRTELATLRLSGLTRQQIQRMTVIEALAATLIGLLLGAIAATLALVGLWIATFQIYGTPVIAIPWTLLGAIATLTVGLTTVTAVAATRSTLNEPAVRAIGAQAQ